MHLFVISSSFNFLQMNANKTSDLEYGCDVATSSQKAKMVILLKHIPVNSTLRKTENNCEVSFYFYWHKDHNSSGPLDGGSVLYKPTGGRAVCVK